MTVNDVAEDMQTIAIRRAEKADLAQVVALDEKVTGIGKSDYIFDLFERYQTRRPDERFFYVAENTSLSPKKIVGFVIGEIRAWEFGSEPCGWVFAISVDHDLRESGTGAALLDRLSGSFQDAGVNRLRTMISRNNHLLMSFFRSRGLMAGPYIQLEKDL
jgi:ribosomal protein S18 acetylase RimI-like enzyme